MAGTIYDVFSVAANTSTGVQALAGNLGGATPKAAIIFASREEDSVGGFEDGAMLSFGFTDGTNVRCAAAMSEDGVALASHDAGNIGSNSSLVQILTATSEAIDGEAIFSSFSADTISIDWTNAPSTAVFLVVILIGGEDVSAGVGQLTASASIGGTATVTGLSLRPNVIFFVSSVPGFAASGAHARISLGCAAFEDPTIYQVGAGVFDREASTEAVPTGTRGAGVLRRDCISARVAVNGAGTLLESAHYELTAVASDGFTITTRNDTFANVIAYLVLDVGFARRWAGIPCILATDTGNHTIDEPNFAPGFLFGLSSAVTSHTEYFANDAFSSKLCVAANDGTDTLGCLWQAESGVTTSDTRCGTVRQIIASMTDAGAYYFRADVDSFGSTGPVLNMGVAPIADPRFGLLVLGSDTIRGRVASETVTISESVVLTAVTAALTDAGSETEAITESFVSVLSTALFPLSETVDISESALLLLGQVLIASETVTISDNSSFGDGPIPMKATKVGAVFQA